MRYSSAVIVALGLAAALAAGQVWQVPQDVTPDDRSRQEAQHAAAADRLRAIWRLSQSHPTIVMLGDSLTATPPWHELTGCATLANRGISSDTTAMVLRRLPDIIAVRPRAVFLMIGVNDVRRGVAADQIAANTRAIVAQLLDAGIAVYRSPILPLGANARENPTTTGERIALANAAADAALAPLPVTTIDLRPRFTGADGLLRPELTSDGLHLSPEAYAHWRDAIAPIVEKHCVVGARGRP